MINYFSAKNLTKTSITLICFIAVSCQSAQHMADRKCMKAQLNYELVSYKYGCPWPISNNSFVQKTKEIIRDTTIYVYIPGEIVHDSVLVVVADSISTPISVLKTKYAISRAWIANNLLQHTLVQVKSEIKQVIQGINKETVTQTQETIKVPYPVEKPVNKPLNILEKILLWSGVIAWVLVTAFAIFKLRCF